MTEAAGLTRLAASRGYYVRPSLGGIGRLRPYPPSPSACSARAGRPPYCECVQVVPLFPAFIFIFSDLVNLVINSWKGF